MKLTIKLIDTTLPRPAFHTKGAVAFDLYARKDIDIAPQSTKIVPANIVVKVPDNHFLMICARSSLPKRGLMVANGIGVIDHDYCGDDDEIGIFLYNFSSEHVHIERGERIAQAILVKISPISSFSVVTRMNRVSRGGFGSTGKK